MPTLRPPFERAMGLAAASGFKIALGPAFLAASRRCPTAGTWALVAVGEMILDKLRIFPPRYRPVMVVPHALAGAWVARESMRDEGIDDSLAPVVGAAVAAGVSCVAPLARATLRKGLGLADPVVGLGEDYLALRLGTETTGLSMGQVGDVLREAIEDAVDRVAPSLSSSVTHLPGVSRP